MVFWGSCDSLAVSGISEELSLDPNVGAILRSLNLEGRFGNIFAAQEIDLEVLKTMSDVDLASIGVDTFGARRKIRMAAMSESQDCDGSFPSFATPESRNMVFEGCSRTVLRNTTKSFGSCMTGTIKIYNASATNGLFDMSIHANSPAQPNTWDFLCTLTRDQPHTATCALTFETPLIAGEGPAWVSVNFNGLVAAADSSCVASRATIVGTYFYDALTDAAGVYAFYANMTSTIV